MAQITIEGDPEDIKQLGQTLIDGLFWQARDASEDGEYFDPWTTFEAGVIDKINKEFN